MGLSRARQGSIRLIAADTGLEKRPWPPRDGGPTGADLLGSGVETNTVLALYLVRVGLKTT